MTPGFGSMGGWRLHIVHETGFAYDGEARASYNEARLTPLMLPTQSVLAADLRVRPSAARWGYADYWGNDVITFQLDEPHHDLKVTAESTVETSTAPRPRGALSRADLAGQDIIDQMDELLAWTPRTAVPSAALEELGSLTSALDPHDAATVVGEHVRSKLTYTPGATGVQTSALEALEVGHGVCQDFTHLALGLLRGIGIPARYVSGYLHPDEAAEPGETGVGESHAWFEYFAGAWNPIDPTNGSPVGPRHVVVARGRDYVDAAPLTGIYHGAPASALGVSVTITRIR